MRTISVNLYRFSELSDKAKQRALNDHRYYETEYMEWWESVYEDAKMIVLQINSFDDYTIDTELMVDAEQVAKNIVMGHGEVCKTYQLAREYLNLPQEDRDDDDFKAKLSWEYHNMLQKEMEYLESDEHLSEVLDDPSIFEFYADGSRYRQIKEG